MKRKFFSDGEIETVKALDELGVYGIMSPISEAAKQTFKGMFGKSVKEVVDLILKLVGFLFISRVVMRKPWQSEVSEWQAELVTEELNQRVDESDGQQKLTIDEVRRFIDALELIQKKINPE